MRHIIRLQDKGPKENECKEKKKRKRKVTAEHQNFWNEMTPFEIGIYYGKISERLTCRSNTIF